ncbi:MAG TPA: hypothetical protein VFI96_07385, partial [Longimicrobiaceae bacterium]|nr:hypothetical protein [Longimicrobiaceae bacterium]
MKPYRTGKPAVLCALLCLAVPQGACAQDVGAESAPAAAEEAATPRAESLPWAAFGRFEVGDEVLVRSSGARWSRATVQEVGKPGEFSENMYLTRESNGLQDWTWYTNVAAPEREPFWTGFFVGDWEVSVPVAMNTKAIGNDLYRVVSGGMRLPPLRVNADGTYAWRVEENGEEKIIRGQWSPREDAPGIILRQADQGADWEMYNATDASVLKIFGRTEIHLSAECCTYQDGMRIPLGPPLTSARVG